MSSRIFSYATLSVVLLFLLGPFVIIVAAALSAGETLAFPPQGLSLKWVIKVFEVESFRASFALSMFLAIFGTLAALVLGVPVAYAASRYKLPFGETIRTIVSAPIIVPGIIVGLALLRYLVLPLDVSVGLALFIAHTALILPYAVRVVSASLDAFILGFVTSFNQVPVSLFLSGPGVRTLPIDMIWYMEITYDPSVAALAALLAFLSISIVFLAERFLGFSRYV